MKGDDIIAVEQTISYGITSTSASQTIAPEECGRIQTCRPSFIDSELNTLYNPRAKGYHGTSSTNHKTSNKGETPWFFHYNFPNINSTVSSRQRRNPRKSPAGVHNRPPIVFAKGEYQFVDSSDTQKHHTPPNGQQDIFAHTPNPGVMQHTNNLPQNCRGTPNQQKRGNGACVGLHGSTGFDPTISVSPEDSRYVVGQSLMRQKQYEQPASFTSEPHSPQRPSATSISYNPSVTPPSVTPRICNPTASAGGQHLQTHVNSFRTFQIENNGHTLPSPDVQPNVVSERSTTSDAHVSSSIDPPDAGADLATLQRQMREFWEGYNLGDVISEHSSMLVLEARLPMVVAFKSLFEYRKSFASVYNEEQNTFMGFIDVFALIDFCLHLWNAETNPDYLSNFCSSLCPCQPMRALQSVQTPPTSCTINDEFQPQEGEQQSKAIQQEKASCRYLDTSSAQKEQQTVAACASSPLDSISFGVKTISCNSSSPKNYPAKMTVVNDIQRSDDVDSELSAQSNKKLDKSRQDSLADAKCCLYGTATKHTGITPENTTESLSPNTGGAANPPFFNQIRSPKSNRVYTGSPLYPTAGQLGGTLSSVAKALGKSKKTDADVHNLSDKTDEANKQNEDENLDYPKSNDSKETISERVSAMTYDVNCITRQDDMVLPLYPVVPPHSYTIDYWIKVCGRPISFRCISVQRTALEAIQMLLNLRCSQVCVWNDELASPLSFLSVSTLLGHMIQNLRGTFPALNLLIRPLKIGREDNILALPYSTPLRQVLEVLRDNQWTSMPLLDDSGCYLGCFSQNHFIYLIAKAFQDTSFVDLNLPVSFFWEKFRKVDLASSGAQCVSYSGSPDPMTHDPTIVEFPAPILLSQQECQQKVEISESDTTGATNASISALLQASHIHGGGASAQRGAGSHIGLKLSQSIISPISNSGQTTRNQFGIPPAVCDPDITIRDALSHMLLSEGNKLIFVDPIKRHVTGLVTMSDLCRFLMGQGGRGRVAEYPFVPHRECYSQHRSYSL